METLIGLLDIRDPNKIFLHIKSLNKRLIERQVKRMPREKELYEPTLESIRNRAKELYPDKLLFSRPEAAKVMGVSVSTLYRRGLGGLITAEQLARTFA